jgi:hypothetical protein
MKEYDVEALSLDSIVRRHVKPGERLAVIKIDIDGAEPALFAGGAEALRTHRPSLFLEFSPRAIAAFGTPPARMFADLCDEYAVYEVQYRPRRIVRLRGEDYASFEARVGQAIGDLVLSPEEVDFSDIAPTN